MSIPSLPPALKPWMMRPRAGQRNSGLDPDASACAEVTDSLAVAAFGSTWPVGVSSTAGFLDAVVLWTSVFGESALATVAGWVFGAGSGLTSAVFSSVFAVLVFSAALSSAFAFFSSAFLSATFFAFAGVSRSSASATSSARFFALAPSASVLGRRSGRHSAPPGAVNRHDDPHPVLDFGRAGKAVCAEQGGRGHAVATRQRIEGLALGDHDRRAADRAPSGG